jgi:hypothetical protein
MTQGSLPATKINNSRKPHPKARFCAGEDAMLKNLICEKGPTDWDWIASRMPGRNIRQCRERWSNYLSPAVNQRPWTRDEDLLLLAKVQEHGFLWKLIPTFFNSRTDINVKSRWNLIQRHLQRANGALNQTMLPWRFPHPSSRTEAIPKTPLQSETALFIPEGDQGTVWDSDVYDDDFMFSSTPQLSDE